MVVDALEDKVAVVTGAASGIGRAVAEQILERGGAVVAVDLDGDKLGWADGHERALTVAGDITSVDTNAAMVKRATRKCVYPRV